MTRRGEYFWTGLSTCHCNNCHQHFTSADAFDRHYVMDQSTGIMECFDPAAQTRKDGQPAFEKILKPKWNPGWVWTKFSPYRGVHPHHQASDDDDDSEEADVA